MSENRISVIAPCWRRPKVLRQFLENHYHLFPRPLLFLAGSPDDECEGIAKEYGNVLYIQRPNMPVSKKTNDVIEIAKGSAKYYLMSGSDDFMSQETYEYYLRFVGYHLGLKNLFFHDSVSKQSFHFKGYSGRKEGTPIGACHMVSAGVMEALGYRPYVDSDKWPREQSTWKKVVGLGVETNVVTMAETGGIVVDVKSEQNIMPFENKSNKNGMYPDSEYITNEVIENSDVWQYIKNL